MKTFFKVFVFTFIITNSLVNGQFPVDNNPNFVSCSLALFPSPCPKSNFKVCGLYYGKLNNCSDGNCGKQFKNDCLACLSGEIHGFIPGDCEDSGITVVNNNNENLDNNYCKNNIKNKNKLLKSKDNELKYCTLEYNPVCGKLFDCKNGICVKEFGNPCSACADPEVEYYNEGPCPSIHPIKPPQEQFNFCPKNPTLALCTRDYQPVCGYYEKNAACSSFDCRKTFSNGCTACNDNQVYKYEMGECESFSLPEPEIPFPQTVKCAAASFLYPCSETTELACGYFKPNKRCIGSNCFAEFKNTCKACSDPRVDTVENGPCPVNEEEEEEEEEEKEEEEFPDFSNKPVSCAAALFMNPCPKINTPTCGFFKSTVNCKDRECFAEFKNGCLACGDKRVESFMSGKCPKKVNQSNDLNSVKICQPSDRNKNCKCKKDNNIYCAKTNLQTFGNYGYEYYSCECEACSDRHVVSVVKGLCPSDRSLSSKPYMCKNKDRTKFCTKEWKGVCAVTQEGLTTVGTVCQGCQNDNIIAVYEERCP